MSASASAFQVGDKFHQYELLEVLGRGGHAVVFHGFDRASDRHVAIKVLHEARHDLKQRARAEGRLLISLRHPNLVEVYDAGVTEGGSVYIVMERLDGRSLRELIRRLHKLTVLEALPIGIQVASGLLAAHARKVIHRDLKPDNIYVLPDGTVKILDFGIAKYLEQSFDTTQERFLQGTPSYMSPEQFQGLPVSYRSDVFALGVILYELLSGMKPTHVDGEPESIDEFVNRLLALDAPPLQALEPRVAPSISQLIQQAMARRAEDRFELEEFLERMQGELELERRRSGLAVPRDLLRAGLDMTDPDFVPEFTALSQQVTFSVRPAPAVTLAGLGASSHTAESTQISNISELPSQRFVTERLFEGDATSVTRTAPPAALTPLVGELGAHPLTQEPLRSGSRWGGWRLAFVLGLLAAGGGVTGLVFVNRGSRAERPVPGISAVAPRRHEEPRPASVGSTAPVRAAAGPQVPRAVPSQEAVPAATVPGTQARKLAVTSKSSPRPNVENVGKRARSAGSAEAERVKNTRPVHASTDPRRDIDPALRVGSGLPEL